jgi:hypothetical protein
MAKDGESGQSSTGMRTEYGDAKVILNKDYLMMKHGKTAFPDGTFCKGRGSFQVDKTKLGPGVGILSDCDIIVMNTGVHWHCV